METMVKRLFESLMRFGRESAAEEGILDYPQSDEEDDDGYSEPDEKIGEIELHYINYTQIINDSESLFWVMDSISPDKVSCYEALIDHNRNDWKEVVQQITGENALINSNILLIDRVQIEEPYRGNGKGAEVRL